MSSGSIAAVVVATSKPDYQTVSGGYPLEVNFQMAVLAAFIALCWLILLAINFLRRK